MPANQRGQIRQRLVPLRGQHALSPQETDELVRVARPDGIVVVLAEASHPVGEWNEGLLVHLPPAFQRGKARLDGRRQRRVVEPCEILRRKALPFRLQRRDQFIRDPLLQIAQTSRARSQREIPRPLVAWFGGTRRRDGS